MLRIGGEGACHSVLRAQDMQVLNRVHPNRWRNKIRAHATYSMVTTPSWQPKDAWRAAAPPQQGSLHATRGFTKSAMRCAAACAV
jgi:hypothetical protein